MRFLPIIFFAFLGISCQSQNKTTSSAQSSDTLTQEQIIQQKIKDGAMLVDVRTTEEFAEGSVPGAVNIPVDQVEQHLEQFKDKKDIIVFCRSGNRSGKAQKILESHGFSNVINGGSWEYVNALLK